MMARSKSSPTNSPGMKSFRIDTLRWRQQCIWIWIVFSATGLPQSPRRCRCQLACPSSWSCLPFKFNSPKKSAQGAHLSAQGAPLCAQGALRVRPCALKVRPSALKEIYKNLSIENPELTKGQLRKSGIDGFNLVNDLRQSYLLNAAFSLKK